MVGAPYVPASAENGVVAFGFSPTHPADGVLVTHGGAAAGTFRLRVWVTSDAWQRWSLRHTLTALDGAGAVATSPGGLELAEGSGAGLQAALLRIAWTGQVSCPVSLPMPRLRPTPKSPGFVSALSLGLAGSERARTPLVGLLLGLEPGFVAGNTLTRSSETPPMAGGW